MVGGSPDKPKEEGFGSLGDVKTVRTPLAMWSCGCPFPACYKILCLTVPACYKILRLTNMTENFMESRWNNKMKPW